MISRNAHHARISPNVRDQRWRACNWIWFHSLGDEQPTNWALSSASRAGPQQSARQQRTSHSDTMWEQPGGNEAKCCSACFTVKSTAVLRVLVVNLASRAEKSLLTWCSWRSAGGRKHQHRAFIYSHANQVSGDSLACTTWERASPYMCFYILDTAGHLKFSYRSRALIIAERDAQHATRQHLVPDEEAGRGGFLGRELPLEKVEPQLSQPPSTEDCSYEC